MVDWELWDKIDGFFEIEEGKCVYNEVLALPENSLIVEIGCYRGRSTVALLCGCRDSASKGKRVLSVDNFSGQGMEIAQSSPSDKFMASELVWNTINGWQLRNWFLGIDTVDSTDWFHTKVASQGQVDMFFIDGCHPKVDEDIRNAWGFLKPGGVLLAHDYWPVGSQYEWIRRKIDETCTNGSLAREGTKIYKAIRQ